jgi:hypothetical protein
VTSCSQSRRDTRLRYAPQYQLLLSTFYSLYLYFLSRRSRDRYQAALRPGVLSFSPLSFLRRPEAAEFNLAAPAR